MVSRYFVYWCGLDVILLDVIDCILVGVCVVVWLVFIGVLVVVVVVLMDLGRGFYEMVGNLYIMWVLYVVIVVFVLVIVGVILVLL